NEKSVQLLKNCGLDFENYKSSLITTVNNFNLEILFLRDDDIPGYVAQGIADLGIVGENVIDETQEKVTYLQRLGFGRCTLKIAIPKDSEIREVGDLQGKSIATSYPVILQQFLDAYKIQADIQEISGSVEIPPRLGLSDAICDIVSTGGMPKSNGLEPFGVGRSPHPILSGRDGREQLPNHCGPAQPVQSEVRAKHTHDGVPEEEKRDLAQSTERLHGVERPT